LPERPAAPRSRVVTVATVALVAAAAASCRLALANVLLVVAVGAGWWAWRRGELAGRPWARVLVLPLGVFALLSLLSATTSLDPLASFANLPRLLVFACVPLAAAMLDERWWGWLVAGLAGMGALMAVWGIVQFLQGADSLENRIRGPLSHYMTYSGWLLLVVLVLLTELLLRPGKRVIWLLPPALLGTVALFLTYTRNAWVGLAVGVLVLAAVWRRRLLLLYPVLAVAIWLLFPRPVLERVISTVDLRQQANYDRLCMVLSGVEMVRDHPWTGVGPDMVSRLYPLYRRDDAPRWRVPHLHNNVLQIAAERGLGALAAYLWFLVAFFTTTWRSLPGLATQRRSAVAAALVAVAGITAAGFFEYNFWDAEIQLLTIVLMGTSVGLCQRSVA